jgi:outer membrane protein TolC
LLREFLEKEGIRRSPELQGIKAAQRATSRRVRSAKRSLYLPRFGLSASAAHRFYEDGVGSESITLPPAIPGGLLPNPDRNSWQVGVSATFPLYEGGRRYAEISQSQAENAQLQTREQALRLGIAQRVRSTLHQAGASFAAIRLSQQAAAAAKENLRLVSDAYSRGAAPVVVLLDAQNQALVAELTASNAAYRFLVDLMSVERSIGTFSFFSNEAEREALLSRLVNHQARRAAEIRSAPEAP